MGKGIAFVAGLLLLAGVAAFLLSRMRVSADDGDRSAAPGTAQAGAKDAAEKQDTYWALAVEEVTAGTFTLDIYVNGGGILHDPGDSGAQNFQIPVHDGDIIRATLTSAGGGNYDLRLRDNLGNLLDISDRAPGDEPDQIVVPYAYVAVEQVAEEEPKEDTGCLPVWRQTGAGFGSTGGCPALLVPLVLALAALRRRHTPHPRGAGGS